MKINPKVLELILDQINVEFTNHATYTELHNWCMYKGYTNSAALFKKQADDELAHRDKLTCYLLDAGYEIPPLELNKHSSKVSDLEKTFKVGLLLEQATTKEFIAIKDAAEKSGDFVSSAMVNELVREQVEEEALFLKILDTCSNVGLFDSATPEWAKGQMRHLVDQSI